MRFLQSQVVFGLLAILQLPGSHSGDCPVSQYKNVVCKPTNIKSSPPCETLNPGQYYCKEPEISPETQSAVDCQPNRLVNVTCCPAKCVQCGGLLYNGTEGAFTKQIPCYYVTGKYDFSTALCLSVFLGMFGVDRFYLGYPAIGLLKLSTFGFFLLGSLIDIILIASQTIGPADGSDYAMPYYGPRMELVRENGDTYYVSNI
ncbi:TM2 domain-containing protein CG10795-like [Oscarella lobularis]|uniref:TM2 domain-containing protein CG10795-like n=1 Tax=Oscarella lobularis TaxID=121494 RepID=UPI0033138203